MHGHETAAGLGVGVTSNMVAMRGQSAGGNNLAIQRSSERRKRQHIFHQCSGILRRRKSDGRKRGWSSMLGIFAQAAAAGAAKAAVAGSALLANLLKTRDCRAIVLSNRGFFAPAVFLLQRLHLLLHLALHQRSSLKEEVISRSMRPTTALAYHGKQQQQQDQKQQQQKPGNFLIICSPEERLHQHVV